MTVKKIKSHLFSDIKIVQDDPPKVEEEKILFKGEDTIEDINGEKVVGNVKYNRSVAIKDLELLRQHAKVQVNKLDAEQLSKFYKILRVDKELKNDPDLRVIFLKDVNKIFHDLKDVEPGTVGAFFIKCSEDFDCDPACENSIFNSDRPRCNHLILFYSKEDQRFREVNSVTSPSICYIYVNGRKNQFNGFSKEDIKNLQSYKCKGYVILYQDYKNQINKQPITLDQLPRGNGQNGNNQPRNNQNGNNQPRNNQNQNNQNRNNQNGNNQPRNNQNRNNQNQNNQDEVDDGRIVPFGVVDEIFSGDHLQFTEWNAINTLIIIIVIIVLLVLIILFAYYYTKDVQARQYEEY